MLQFHLFCALTAAAITTARWKETYVSDCVCVCVSRTRQATSWSVKLWVTIYHLLGLTWFTSINDENCSDAVRATRCAPDWLVTYRDSAHWRVHRRKRITEINWIFDLSWRKFDVNEIGHFTGAFFSCRRRRHHHQSDSGRQHKKIAGRADHRRIPWTGVGKLHLQWYCRRIEIQKKRKYIKIVSSNHRRSRFTWCHS